MRRLAGFWPKPHCIRPALPNAKMGRKEKTSMSSGRWNNLWFTAPRNCRVLSYIPTWAQIFLLSCTVCVKLRFVPSHGGTVRLCIAGNQAVHLKMVAACKHTLSHSFHLLLFTLVAQKTHTWIQWASEWHHLESALLLSSAVMYGFSSPA